jgi:hypothetical protein
MGLYLLDVGVIIIYSFHEIIFDNDYLLVTLNGLLWVPQIMKSFRERSRLGPESYFICVLSVSHIFFPLYVRGCPQNLFQREHNYLTSSILVIIMTVQAYIVREQQKRNPRFFIPKKWRRNLNQYNYFHEFPRQQEGQVD